MRTVNIYKGYEILESIEHGSIGLEMFKQFRNLETGNILNYRAGKLEIQETNGKHREASCSDIMYSEFEELNGLPVTYAKEEV